MLLGFSTLLMSWALAGGAPQAPLPALDAAFREAYHAARDRAFEQQGPVLLATGDQLVLYQDQTVVAEARIRPERYHRLKTVAHVPLCVRLLAGPAGDRPLAPGTAAELEALRGRLAEALGGLEDLFPPGATLRRQRLVLEASRAFLDEALGAGRIPRGALDAYDRAMREPIQGNIREAAALELAALRQVVQAWRRQHLAASWDRVKVVVIGSHMARDGEVSWQFFSRLLGQDCAGGRLVFAEGLWEPKEAMGLLATHGVDRDLGQAFFGDPRRTHRDVLGGAAKKWLEDPPGGR
jgi:hypothetical protein